MILYTMAMLVLGALIGGYLYKIKFKKEIMKDLDVMYHKGFESGMLKAKEDMDASFEAYLRAQIEEEEKAKIDKIAEEIEREIKMGEKENDLCCGSGCGHCDDYSVALSENKPKKKKASTTKKKRTAKNGGSKK